MNMICCFVLHGWTAIYLNRVVVQQKQYLSPSLNCIIARGSCASCQISWVKKKLFKIYCIITSSQLLVIIVPCQWKSEQRLAFMLRENSSEHNSNIPGLLCTSQGTEQSVDLKIFALTGKRLCIHAVYQIYKLMWRSGNDHFHPCSHSRIICW